MSIENPVDLYHCRSLGKARLSRRRSNRLIRFLTLLLVWTAALALPLVAAPGAHAMAMAAPCPMEAGGMSAADHAAMDGCDHGAGGSDQTVPCKPGMACFATAAALPAASIDVALVAFDEADLFQAPARALASLPPDRDIRPPISL